MTLQTAKQIVKTCSVLSLIHGAALVLLMAYILFSLTNGMRLTAIVISHVPLAIAIYLMWLGYRGLSSLTPGIVKQLCNIMPIIAGIDLSIPLKKAENSIVMISILISIMLLVFAFSIFGTKILCRQLFPLETTLPCPNGANEGSHG